MSKSAIRNALRYRIYITNMIVLVVAVCLLCGAMTAQAKLMPISILQLVGKSTSRIGVYQVVDVVEIEDPRCKEVVNVVNLANWGRASPAPGGQKICLEFVNPYRDRVHQDRLSIEPVPGTIAVLFTQLDAINHWRKVSYYGRGWMEVESREGVWVAKVYSDIVVSGSIDRTKYGLYHIVPIKALCTEVKSALLMLRKWNEWLKEKRIISRSDLFKSEEAACSNLDYLNKAVDRGANEAP